MDVQVDPPRVVRVERQHLLQQLPRFFTAGSHDLRGLPVFWSEVKKERDARGRKWSNASGWRCIGKPVPGKPVVYRRSPLLWVLCCGRDPYSYKSSGYIARGRSKELPAQADVFFKRYEHSRSMNTTICEARASPCPVICCPLERKPGALRTTAFCFHRCGHVSTTSQVKRRLLHAANKFGLQNTARTSLKLPGKKNKQNASTVSTATSREG